MALIIVRNTETGEVLQLDESWLTRFPEDPFEPVPEEELANLPAAPYGVVELQQETTEAPAEQPATDAKKPPAAPATDAEQPRGRF
jgi:hypothetical protein